MSGPDADPGSAREVESLRRVAESALGWLDALARASVVSVPTPVYARDGSFVIEATADRVDGFRRCAVFEWIEGEPIEDHLNRCEPRARGRGGGAPARARSHVPGPHGLRVWDTPFPYGEAVVLFDPEHASSFTDHERSVFLAVRAATEAAIARLADAEPPRMLHADLHEHNLFVDGDVVRVLDFDDSMPGWPAQDLSVIWFELAEQDDIQALMLALRRGFERVAPWPERVPGEIAVFAADRALHLANYVVQDHDPAYRERAPELVRAWA